MKHEKKPKGKEDVTARRQTPFRNFRWQILFGVLCLSTAMLLLLHNGRTPPLPKGTPRAEPQEINDRACNKRIAGSESSKKLTGPEYNFLKPGPNEVSIGKWSNYPKNVPPDILKIRIAGGAIDASGRITYTIVRLLNLTESEEISANRIIEKSMAEVKSKTLSRLIPVPGRENKYRIPADVDEAKAAVEALGKALTSAIGQDRGSDLLNSLDLIHYYGAYGALDSEITFERTQVGSADNPSNSLRARYTLTSPTTGAFVAGGELLEEDFGRMFGGDAFVTDEK